MTVKRVIFIRPGETNWNREHRWQGWVQTALNEHGKQQAQQLAKYVRNIGIEALYSSDLRRAVETATLLSEALEVEPTFDERLRERNIGNWQGLTMDEIRAWYADDYAALLDDPQGYTVPGGEARSHVRKRMVNAFESILAQERGETVGVVTHTTATRELLAEIIKKRPDEDDTKQVLLTNTSVTTIQRNEKGDWSIITMDDISHLEGLEGRRYFELEDQGGGQS